MALPLPKAFWPLTISAGVNDKIDFNRGGVKVATIAAATYYSAALLAAAVVTALEAADATPVWACSVSATGRVTISAGATSFTLLFSTGANAATSARHVLGFGVVDTASATSATGQYQHQNGWYAPEPVVDDTLDLPAYECAASRSLGGQTYALDFATLYDRVIALAFLPATKVWKDLEGTAVNEAIQRLWDDGWMRFRWWADATVEATYGDYVMSPDTRKALPRDRLSSGNPLYALKVKLWKYAP
jgi:hypothetical protein